MTRPRIEPVPTLRRSPLELGDLIDSEEPICLTDIKILSQQFLLCHERVPCGIPCGHVRRRLQLVATPQNHFQLDGHGPHAHGKAGLERRRGDSDAGSGGVRL